MEVGKCVHADTEIEIKIPNNELITDFVKIKKYKSKNVIIDIVNFYKKYPQYKGKLLVNTQYGYKNIIDADQTDYSIPLEIVTDNNKKIICSKNHKIKTENNNFKYASTLKINDKIQTNNGISAIIKIKNFRKKIPLYDIEVAEVHEYYSNGIVSHNSSIFQDGIVFALFGKTLKNTNNQYISNRNCDKKLETYAKLTFVVDNQRYRSECKVTGCCQMTLLKQINSDLDEWEDITQSTVVKTRQYIQDHILGCSFDIFKSSVIISASECVNFYEGMSKNAKRNYIENIFNLNCFGNMFNTIKTDINETKKELSYTNNEIIKTSQQLETLTSKYETYEKNLQQNLIDIKQSIIEKTEQIKQIQENIAKYNNLIESSSISKEELNSLQKDEKQLLNNKEKIEREIDKAQYKIETIQKTIEEISSIKEGLCENCIKVVNQKYNFDKQVKSIEVLNDLIKKDNDIILNIDNKHLEVIDKIKKLENKIDILKANETELYKLKISLQSLSNETKKEVNHYKSIKEQANNPFADLLEQTKESLSKLKEKVLLYSKNVKHLEILKDVCSENGVKRIIIKDIVKILNSLIQKYLNEIGADYLVYFDESFDFKFITMNGECEYSSFSTGERKRIQISTILAFIDLILNGKLNSNILILDEILDEGIDSVAIKNIINILKRKSTETNQSIFIISHRSEISEDNVFDHVIEVVKEKGISHLNIN